MSEPGLEKQIVPPPIEGNAQLVALKKKIDAMQVLYAVLFITSLVILVIGFGGMPLYGHVAWAASLGGAVIVRLTRNQMVRRYNRALAGGGPVPLA